MLSKYIGRSSKLELLLKQIDNINQNIDAYAISIKGHIMDTFDNIKSPISELSANINQPTNLNIEIVKEIKESNNSKPKR